MAWSTAGLGELLFSPGKRLTCPVLRLESAQSMGCRIGSKKRSRASFEKMSPRSTRLSRMIFEVRSDSFQKRLLIFVFLDSTPALANISFVLYLGSNACERVIEPPRSPRRPFVEI